MGGESGASTTTKLVVTAAAVGAGALAYYCYMRLAAAMSLVASQDAAVAAVEQRVQDRAWRIMPATS